MATRPLSSINEGEQNGWEKLTGKQGKTDTKIVVNKSQF